MHQISVLIPLGVGIAAVFGTILIQALPLRGTVWFARRERRLGHAGRGFWIDTAIVALVVLGALVAHLSEIALWAVIFVLSGEFVDFGTAYYHSAVNFTTLGYGDIILSPRWGLLGPLEAADGMLMFGVSTAMIFTLIQRLAKARFAEAES
jgi:hypothetical protein